MKTNPLAKSYAYLTPEERFRLLVAASGRGDNVEQDRVIRASESIRFAMKDCGTYARAFDEIATQMFLEALDHACQFSELLPFFALRVDHASELASAIRSRLKQHDVGDEILATADDSDFVQQFAELVFAFGYLLRVKAEGWKLFCERLNIPPFWQWESLPGFSRLRRTLAVAEQLVCSPKQFLDVVNAQRAGGQSKLDSIPRKFTAAGVADLIEQEFRRRVAWWGGPKHNPKDRVSSVCNCSANA